MKQKRFDPPTYLLIAIVAMIVLHMGAPGPKLLRMPFSLVGMFPLAAGLGMNVVASEAFRRANTTIKPFRESRSLLTGSLYRYSRHPMYAGMILALAGMAVLLGTTTPFLVLVPFAFVMNQFANIEERGMEKTFGDQYRIYRVRVRKWL